MAAGNDRSSTVDVATLVERCRRGDALAWEALVRRFQGRVFAVALHHVRDREEARDLAQDVFLRLYQRLDTYRPEQSFLAWMLSVARNACIDRLRRKKARPPLQDIPAEERWDLAQPGPDPEDDADADSRRRLLHRALDGMGENGREIILLKDIHGLKLEEIAEMLSLPIGTVKSRTNRARLELVQRVRELDPSYGTS